MSAIDFAHFKKIAQDKKCATLRHPDGHTIKIAIANLKPDLKKKLEALPLHQAEPEAPVEALDTESPAMAESDPISETQTPAPQTEAVAPVPAPAPAAQSAPAAAPAPEPAQSAGEPMTLTARPPTPQEEATEMTKQNMLVGQDLSNGHIAPKTYSDLFAEKSTLGKVGTLFGLMLSGAGSGLTHQPNAMLAMMDRQIQNDLEAQKTNQTNKQNWFKLSLEHTRNQSVNALTNSEAYKTATEAEKQQMLNKAMGVADVQASTHALNVGRMVALQDQQNNINKMPPGPQRDAAQNTLGGLLAANASQMYEDNFKVAQQKQQMMGSIQPSGAVKTNPPPAKGEAQAGVHYDVVDQNKLNEGMRKGLLFGPDAGKIPGAIPPEKHASINKEVEELGSNRNNWADAQDAFNKLSKIKHAGQVPGANALAPATTTLGALIGAIGSGGIAATAGGALGHLGGALGTETIKDYFERERQIQVNALVQRLRDRGMSGDDAIKQAESILPKWNDTEKTLPEVHYQLQQHFKALEDNKTPNLKQYNLLTPQPKYKYTAPAKEVINTPKATRAEAPQELEEPNDMRFKP